MAVSKKTTNSRLDFAQAIRDGVEQTEVSETTESMPAPAPEQRDAMREETKLPQRSGPVSLRQQLEVQQMAQQADAEESRAEKPETNLAVTKLTRTNADGILGNSSVLRKRFKAAGRPKSVYLTREVLDYLTPWVEEGYTLSSVVNYIILQYMEAENRDH